MASYIEVFSTVGYQMVESVGNPANAHHGYQIFYILEGDAVFSISGEKYRLRKNECIIVPPFAEHYYVSGAKREPTIFDIQFTPDFFYPMYSISLYGHMYGYMLFLTAGG